MKAIEEIVLEHETAPSIGSEICTEMNTGSKVIVKNEEVAKILNPHLHIPNIIHPKNNYNCCGANS